MPWRVGMCSWDGGDPRVLPSMLTCGDTLGSVHLCCALTPWCLERRMPWRVAVYYWESGDMRVLPLLNALAAFFLNEKQVRSWPCVRPWVSGQSPLLVLVLISVPVGLGS